MRVFTAIFSSLPEKHFLNKPDNVSVICAVMVGKGQIKHEITDEKESSVLYMDLKDNTIDDNFI